MSSLWCAASAGSRSLQALARADEVESLACGLGCGGFVKALSIGVIIMVQPQMGVSLKNGWCNTILDDLGSHILRNPQYADQNPRKQQADVVQGPLTPLHSASMRAVCQGALICSCNFQKNNANTDPTNKSKYPKSIARLVGSRVFSPPKAQKAFAPWVSWRRLSDH